MCLLVIRLTIPVLSLRPIVGSICAVFLVASIFSPINGGSAVVYETLCRFAPMGSMVVFAPWRHYIDGREIEGWREHDAAAPYPVYRAELLRPPDSGSRRAIAWESVWRLLSDRCAVEDPDLSRESRRLVKRAWDQRGLYR
ncbi:MAG: hypothetical protein MZV65_28190 [Chromatiales bacterium]|nr:hypothetical protein [Chromatiales bacterium]